MRPGWVAGGVRARLLARRRLGRAGARDLAGSASAGEAVERLATSPYGHAVRVGQDVTTARRGVAATALWHLRVLAGWLPAGAADVVRVFAGPFEIANVAGRLGAVDGAVEPEPFRLGALALAWPRVATAASVGEVRAALAASSWGDPGGDAAAEVIAGLRLAWAGRLATLAPDAAGWGQSAAALVVAEERFVHGRALTPAAAGDARRLVGRGWEAAGSLAALAGSLPAATRFLLANLGGVEELWRAEARWWRRVDDEAAALLARSRPGRGTVTAAAALLLVDVWRVQAALEALAWGDAALERFDAVA